MTAVHSRWSRLGLDTRGRCGGLACRTPGTAPLAETETVAPPSEAEVSAWTPRTDYAPVVVPGRPEVLLSVEDLVIAVDLMRLRSLAPAQAVALVRTDVAAARKAATETTHNGMSESAIHSWLDAWSNDGTLPSLNQE